MTFDDLKTRILSWANDSSAELTADLPTIIRLAEIRVATDLDLRPHRKTVAVALTAGVGTLPTDMLVLREVLAPRRLDARVRSWVDEYEGYEGTPKYYCQLGNDLTTGIQVKVAPAMTGTATIEYTAQPLGLSDTNATTWLSTYAEELLFFACLVEAISWSNTPTPAQEVDKQQAEMRYQAALSARRQIEQLATGTQINTLKV